MTTTSLSWKSPWAISSQRASNRQREKCGDEKQHQRTCALLAFGCCLKHPSVRFPPSLLSHNATIPGLHYLCDAAVPSVLAQPRAPRRKRRAHTDPVALAAAKCFPLRVVLFQSNAACVCVCVCAMTAACCNLKCDPFACLWNVAVLCEGCLKLKFDTKQFGTLTCVCLCMQFKERKKERKKEYMLGMTVRIAPTKERNIETTQQPVLSRQRR